MGRIDQLRKLNVAGRISCIIAVPQVHRVPVELIDQDRNVDMAHIYRYFLSNEKINIVTINR